MKTTLKRVLALVMALTLLASVCVFTAMAAEELSVATADELIDAVKNHKGAQIKLTADIVLNDGVTFSYDEENGLIKVNGKDGEIAQISTGEKTGTAGEVVSGSLESLSLWAPFGSLNGCTIDGDGHKIVGIVIKPSAAAIAGFVANLNKDEVIKNLAFENALVLSDGSQQTGLLAGTVYGTVEKVTATGAVVFAYNVPNFQGVGGLMRRTVNTRDDETKTETFSPVVTDCSFDGTVLAAGVSNVTSGGVVAQCIGGNITNCVNYGYVKTLAGITYSAAGVVGLLEPTNGKAKAGDNGAPINAYIKNCANYGKISANTAGRAGGVVGFIDLTWSANEEIVVHNIYNAGDVINGNGVVARTSGVSADAKLKSADVTYAFTDGAKSVGTGTFTSVFNVKSLAKGDTDKILSYLNDGAAAFEGLKKWEKKDGVCVLTSETATYNDKFSPSDFATEDIKEDEELTILSAKVLNEKEIELTFSRQVTLADSVWASIRYTDESYNIRRDEALEDPYLQWGTELRLNGSNKGIAKYTADAKGTLADVLAMKGYEDKGYKLYYCIEGLNSSKLGTQQAGYLDQIQASDGSLLVANKPNAGGVFDGVYVAIEDVANATKPFTADTELPAPVDEGTDVTVLSAKVLNEREIELTFSEQVVLADRVWACIRYTDDKLVLQKDNALEGDLKNLQFAFSLRLNGSNKGIAKLSSEDRGTLAEILAKKGYEDKDYKVYLCFEGLPSTKVTKKTGYLDQIQTADGTKMLVANKPSAGGEYDGIYIDIEDTANATKAFTEDTKLPDPEKEDEPVVEDGPNLKPAAEGGITVTSAKAVSPTAIELTFSEAVKLNGRIFSAIRYTNKDLALRQDKTLEDPNLQFYGSLSFNGTNKVTFNYSGSKPLYDVLTMKGYEDLGYYALFCLEGLPVDAITDPAENFLDNITSLDGTKLLASNKPSPNKIYDGYYVKIEDVDKAKKGADLDPAAEGGITVTAAKVVTPTQIELTFSEAVKLNGRVFTAIRYTNDKLALQQDKTLADPNLQFYGNLVFNGTNKVTFNYTSATPLYDVLTMKGYEDKGYFVYFCFEGLPNDAITEPAENFIDNITSLDGTKLLASNKPSSNKIYDGYYVAVEDIEKAKEGDAPQSGEIDPEITPTEGGVTILSAKAISNTQIELTFSEPVKKASNFFSAIRYTNSKLALQQDKSLKDPNLQWNGALIFNGTNKATFTYSGTDKTLYEILTFKGYEDKGYCLTFCIEGLPVAGIENGEIGYIDNITSADETKLLSANKPSPNGNYDGYYVPIEDIEKAKSEPEAPTHEPTEGGILIESAKVIDETHIELTFSEPVVRVSNFFCGIRYTDKNLNLQQDKNKSDPNLQWSAGLTLNGTNKGVFEFKNNLYGVLTKKGYEDKGYYVYFCIEGLPNDAITDPQVGFIDNIQSTDHTNRLSANKPQANGIYDGYYVPIEDIEKAKPSTPPKEAPEDGGFSITSAKVLNEREIELTFEEEVYMLGSAFVGIRYTNDAFQVQKDGGEYLQWNGGLTVNGSHKGIFTLSADSTRSMADIVSMKGYEDKGYKLYLCIEGLPGTDTTYVGYVDCLLGTVGDKMVKADKEDANGIYDGVYAAITDIENATKKYSGTPTKLPEGHIPQKPLDPAMLNTPDDGVKVLSCEVVNKGQLKLKFSEPVSSKGSVFTAIRYTDAKLALQRDESRENPYLQFTGSLTLDGSNIGYWSPSAGYELDSVLKMTGYKDKKYYVFLCFEGLPNAAITSPKEGYIDTIVGKSGKLLGCNKPSAGGIYDGLYMEIAHQENATKKFLLPMKNLPAVDLVSVKAINSAQLELTFSEPVLKQSNCFAAIRYTDKDMTLQKNGDAYLQFSGNLNFNGTERVIWTCSGGNLYDVLTLKGYERSGYFVYFCIEGLPGGVSSEVGYIDNITSVDGKKLLRCTPEKAQLNGNYDGLYMPVQDIEKAEGGDIGGTVDGIFVDEINSTGDYSLELIFSDNIYLVGAGSAETQFIPVKASIRFVNPTTYETLIADDTLMEFPAEFNAEDGTNVGTFELRSKLYTIRQLFGKVGFNEYEELKDAVVVLALEGTDDFDVITLPLPGYVDNIQSEDGKKLLVAMKSATNGIADCYLAMLEDINFSNGKDEDPAAKLIDTANMTNKEREAYNALSEEERTAKLNEVVELLNKATAGELTEAGKSAFGKLLSKNGISENDVNAYYVGMNGSVDLGGFPVTLTYDVSEKEFDMNDKIYVYRVNEDGSVTKLDRVTATVANGSIKNVKFMTDKVSDFIITNKDLETESGSGINPWVLGGAGAAVVAAGAIIAIVLGKKKKKKEN